MIKINQAVVVEGKYDKIKLSSIIDAPIIVTNGFGIFKDKDKISYIKRVAKTKGIIILTDSDNAGFMIRKRILQAVDKDDEVINVYIPDVFGKEKRKSHLSAEGKLGVEGIDVEIIKDAFQTGKTPNINHNILASLPISTYWTTNYDKLIEKWDKIFEIKESFAKDIENARANKEIGSALDAKITIYTNGEEFDFITANKENITLASIVSEIEVVNSDEKKIVVEKSTGVKCPRCWTYSNEFSDEGI